MRAELGNFLVPMFNLNESEAEEWKICIPWVTEIFELRSNLIWMVFHGMYFSLLPLTVNFYQISSNRSTLKRK